MVCYIKGVDTHDLQKAPRISRRARISNYRYHDTFNSETPVREKRNPQNSLSLGCLFNPNTMFYIHRYKYCNVCGHIMEYKIPKQGQQASE